MNNEAIKDLLLRIADDELVIGHRNSEWTGLGPVLEEDIAFSSMAQDEIGHAQALYFILHEHFGMPHPDQNGFNRTPEDFRSCTMVEQPIGDYAYSLARHLLYELAEQVRWNALTRSSFKPLADQARKIAREEKYHSMHAVTWFRQLGRATSESQHRMQEALEFAMPQAFGIWEPTAFTDILAQEGVQPTEHELQTQWLEIVDSVVKEAGLRLPMVMDQQAFYGGRIGKHSAHLDSLLAEMTEVFVLDPTAKW